MIGKWLRVGVAAMLAVSVAGAVPALAKRLNDGDVVVRRQSAVALGRIGAAARPALPVLRKAQRDAARIVREVATEAVERIESSVAPRSAG